MVFELPTLHRAEKIPQLIYASVCKQKNAFPERNIAPVNALEGARKEINSADTLRLRFGLFQRLISLFFNFHAELLTLCISGKFRSCIDIFKDINYAVQEKYTPLDPGVYFYQASKDEQIIEGAGCWHPSFPALNAHVQILAAHAVDIISDSIATKQETGIASIVKRKNFTPQTGDPPGALVEKVWGKEYCQTALH